MASREIEVSSGSGSSSSSSNSSSSDRSSNSGSDGSSIRVAPKLTNSIRAIDRASVHKICSGQVVTDLSSAVNEVYNMNRT